MSDYQKRLQAAFQSGLEIGEQLTTQKMWDYIQMELRNPEVVGRDTFGPKRLAKLFLGLKKAKDRYHIAFTNDKEADYYQEEMDSKLREIWKDKTLSFYDRYPEIKKIRYDKAKKGWR